MVYDKIRHCDLVYSEVQEVGYNNWGYAREHQQRYIEQIRTANDGKPFIRVNNLKEFGIGALGLFISVVTALALCLILPCGKHLVFHMGAAFVCGYVGLVKFTSKKTYEDRVFYKDELAEKIAGIIMMAEAVTILVMWFNLPFATDWECSFFMAGIFLLVMGIYKTSGLVMFFTGSSRIYTRSVEAECIGYVRKRSRVSDSDGHDRTVWYNSPVFKYYIDGREMIAFYESLSKGIDSKLPRGPVTIRVNKDDNGSIMNPSKRGVAGSVIGILILLALGAFLVYSVLNGHVHGSSISM